MKRFLVFPLLFVFGGTLLFPASLWQGMAGVLPVAFGTVRASGMGFWFNLFNAGYQENYGFAQQVLGLLTGLALAIWDLLRNKDDQSSLKRLLPNFLYCGFYAFCLCFANASLGLLTLSVLKNGSPLISVVVALQFLGAFAFNFTAFFWAAIRSITTDDVLTPLVLRDKLRERARLN